MAKVIPADTAASTSEIKLFYIALGDEGKSGKKIGCGDSVVAVKKSIAPTAAPLTAALESLLSYKDQTYGETGLRNFLTSPTLKLESVNFVEGKATVNLSGEFLLGGVCDSPRVEAQLKETVLQFPTVTEVEIFVDGKKLEDLLSGRG
ncbi:MAG TPA: GerMN domain-containing protein [Candidatus Gracilibacteria bacterium]|nr:GerMN domain-containing protein [Candidatus Gracilibacteria bacterium]